MRIGKGKPQVGQSSRIGRRRIEEIRILSFPGILAGNRIGAVHAWHPARLGNLLGCLGPRDGHRRACDHGGGERTSSLKFTHHDLPFEVDRLPVAKKVRSHQVSLQEVERHREENQILHQEGGVERHCREATR